MAAASIDNAHKSSGSKLCTWFLPHARAIVCVSSVITLYAVRDLDGPDRQAVLDVKLQQ
jgi:hypothetical protein